ncbi:DUF2723 domain-containing protein [Chitinophaga pendula]|uniref:glycosyltransferase family 117 protein n=1 Tax=Chitinophaga pendula TaxID=2849666 RepID=UPI001CED0595|nr:DUF2723 domain-containing protein [Chitinophaga pendula]UCJ05158.1 DUF2723 domain-containing protein [Chitinophaga pendula]
MNFNKLNTLLGWGVCLIACTVYLSTMEATASLWDCGEFIAAAWKLQIPHPPGAPLFLLIGRLFTMWLPPSQVSLGMNILSALASGFTILFLFWTITHFARKLLLPKGMLPDGERTIAILGAGVVGALAYTFSDSFWFSAVEGEVYALSSLFTAVVFWAILKWEEQADQPFADRWLVLIAFIMGLSIGVHLLNLLTIPAIVMVYYFRRYKPTVKGGIMAFLVGCAITGIIQTGLIQYPAKIASVLEVWLVNSFHLPFNSGVVLFIVLISVVLWAGFRWANRKRYYHVRLALYCTTFLLIGYSTYITTLIRSNANPGLDMYNVDNPMALKGYLGREQYGDFPLVYGQTFTAKPVDYEKIQPMYVREGDHYALAGHQYKAVYDHKDMMLFPRVWDSDTQQGHANAYRQWLGLAEGQAPTFADNLRYFFTYQLNFMYLRYFFWNFAGKQNDIQGNGNVRDSNWISGIPFIDNLLYGDQSTMPDSLLHNKAHNTLFFLPFILGILGLLYHYRGHRGDSLVVGLLFFFTGVAIVLYINQPGAQPRERDYAYVGSFYAFAIWIGLGTLAVYQWMKKRSKLAYTPVVATVLCMLAVPVLMASQEWDDHDRSNKVIARDAAKSFLESCAPNAILFTLGDNETYPLWYAQEVEGVRPDVRIIHSGLLAAEWYINQQRQRINQSAPVPLTLSASQYNSDQRNYVLYHDAGIFPQDKAYNLREVIQFVGTDDPRMQLTTTRGDQVNFLPSKQLFVPVDKQQVMQQDVVSVADKDRIVSPVTFQLKKDGLLKNELALLDIIASNDWKRPIYVTTPAIVQGLGLDNYLQSEGLTFRLVPAAIPAAADGQRAEIPIYTEKTYKAVMQKFAFGNADKKGIYFDEPNRVMLQRLRDTCTRLAIDLAEKGDKAKAKEVLDTMDRHISEANFPYAMTSQGNFHNIAGMQTAYAYYLAGDTEKAKDISDKIIKDCTQQIRYIQSLPADKLSGDLQADYDRAAQFIIPQLQKMKETFATANQVELHKLN